MRATRSTVLEEFVETGRKRLDKMMAFGVTTVEGEESGYGLDEETEIKRLEAMRILNESHPVDIAATFLSLTAYFLNGREKDEFNDYMIEVAEEDQRKKPG